MPRVAPPGEMKTSPACFPGPNVLPIPTATAPPNLPQPCCSAAQCNTLPPHAPSNPASNRPNPGRNPWIEVVLGQIGLRGSRTASAGFQAPSTSIMSHLCHLTPSNTLPPYAPSNPASNRPNPGRNPWIEVALGQIGPRGSRTASAGFQAPSARMSHLRHLTPLYSSTQSVNTGGAMAAN